MAPPIWLGQAITGPVGLALTTPKFHVSCQTGGPRLIETTSQRPLPTSLDFLRLTEAAQTQTGAGLSLWRKQAIYQYLCISNHVMVARSFWHLLFEVRIALLVCHIMRSSLCLEQKTRIGASCVWRCDLHVGGDWDHLERLFPCDLMASAIWCCQSLLKAPRCWHLCCYLKQLSDACVWMFHESHDHSQSSLLTALRSSGLVLHWEGLLIMASTLCAQKF